MYAHRVQSLLARKQRQQKHELAGHTSHNQKTALLLHLHSLGPSQGIGPPTVGSSPTSVNPVKIILPRCAQKPISQLTVDS